jgi:tetratricopeptide (TPR) repeat protein
MSAVSNLGGVYISTLRIDEGLGLVQQSLQFFRPGNYPRNVSYCLTQLGRGYRRKGHYDAALQALNEKLELSKQSNSDPAIADSEGEIGAVLVDQEKLPAALEKYDASLKVYERVQNQLRTLYSKINRGNILWRMGNYSGAQLVMNDLTAVTDDPESKFKQLRPLVKLMIAQARLSQNNLPEAIRMGNEALTGADPDVAIQARYTLGLAKALSGDPKSGWKLCEEAVNMAAKAGDFGLHARALLAQAEVARLGNDAQSALKLATEAQTKFARGSQLESEWRAWVIAARASQQLGDKAKSEEQLRNAQNVRSQLEQQWGADAFKQYSLRPDVQAYSQ